VPSDKLPIEQSPGQLSSWHIDSTIRYIRVRVSLRFSTGARMQVAAALKGCRTAICDKVLHSARGAITAVTQLIHSQGRELREGDICR
jgi:hypothetical protein